MTLNFFQMKFYTDMRQWQFVAIVWEWESARKVKPIDAIEFSSCLCPYVYKWLNIRISMLWHDRMQEFNKFYAWLFFVTFHWRIGMETFIKKLELQNFESDRVLVNKYRVLILLLLCVNNSLSPLFQESGRDVARVS